MFSIVAPEGITAFYVAVISLNALIGWATQPHAMSMCAAGKTEMEGRVGVLFGHIFKRICTIAWVLTGLCAIGLYMGKDVEIDQVYGLMAADLLPAVAPGLVGLLIASMLAGVMSSCDAFMVASSALFTENIYRPLLAKDRSDRHYVLVGRITSAVVVLCGVYFAYEMESVVKGLEVFWKIAAMMGIAFWVGLAWRRATVAGAWASTLVSFAAWLFTGTVRIAGRTLWDFDAQLAPHLPGFLLYEGGLYLPWQMIFYLLAGLVTLVVVSLFTRPVPAERLDQLYACLRTPVSPNEPETKPFTLPEGTRPAPRSVLIAHPDFEIWRPTWVGMAGFVGGWAMVGLLIWAFYWILGFGA
jgi:Na+/proline symporter